jgi:hypothetical protein
MRLTIAVLALSFGLTSSTMADDHDHSFCHHIFHHATSDRVKNGCELLQLVGEIKDASATNPYMIHLDAGTYTVPVSVNLGPYISIKGVGITTTILEAANSSMVTTLFFQDQLAHGWTPAVSNQSVSDMTIEGIQPLTATVDGFLFIDHVQLISTTGGQSAIDLITAGSHFMATNSLLGNLELDSLVVTSTTPSAVSSIIGSEVDRLYVQTAPYFTLACMADYNGNGTPIAANCL